MGQDNKTQDVNRKKYFDPYKVPFSRFEKMGIHINPLTFKQRGVISDCILISTLYNHEKNK